MEEIVATLERSVHAVAVRLGPLGITQAEAHVLARLARGDVTLQELQRAFGHKPSTLTAVVDRLEARGYAVRKVNPSDRRSVVVSLTRRGRPVAGRVLKAVESLDREIAAACSPSDLAGFRRVTAYVTSMASPNE